MEDLPRALLDLPPHCLDYPLDTFIGQESLLDAHCFLRVIDRDDRATARHYPFAAIINHVKHPASPIDSVFHALLRVQIVVHDSPIPVKAHPSRLTCYRRGSPIASLTYTGTGRFFADFLLLNY